MIRVAIDDLRNGMVLARDVYSEDRGLILIAPAGTVLKERLVLRFREHGVHSVLIESGEIPPQALRPERPDFIADIGKPKAILAETLREDALKGIEKLFEAVRLGADVKHAIRVVRQLDDVVEQVIHTLSGDVDALINIRDLQSYDEYTYHHSLSVAVLSIAIAQNLGFSQEWLNLIGRSAMLHDIGKTFVPVRVINKPERLTSREFELVKRHSREGAEYLIENVIGDETMWRGVLCHHERFDGSGYPYGLRGDKIPAISRIIAIADVYDALTSNRPYRTPMQPHEAVEHLMGNAGTQFDYDIVQAFLRKLELYPIGSFVQLSNGRPAIVVDVFNALRPVVRLIDTGDELDLFSDFSCLNITITHVIEDPFREVI